MKLTEVGVTTEEKGEILLDQIIERLCIRCGNNRRGITDIRHIHQIDTWDCGLTCIQMVTNWLHDNNLATQEEQLTQKRWMIEFVKAKSLWTIDLVMLLQHMLQDVSARNDSSTSTHISLSTYLFCSKKFGVDESYNKLLYYRDAFSADKVRVTGLFDVAEQQKLMKVNHLSLDVLINLVTRENVVGIVLLDNTIFAQLDTDENKQESGLPYSGHYVVLCGISTDENDLKFAKMNSLKDDGETYNYCMVIKNPGVWKETQFVTPRLFETSWRAKGTDEDIILIAKHHYR